MAIDRAAAEYLDFACRLAVLAGERILPHFRRALVVDDKSGGAAFDPVTAADREAEEAIRREITARFPEHAILGEEHGRTEGRAGFTWVIDPIDGTRSFILGQLHWGTLIALNDGTRPVVGVMHQPFVGETFVGGPDHAEWRRGTERRRLRVRACARVGDAVVCTTHPNVFTPEERAVFDQVAASARMTRYGGDCYQYCLLAMGLVDVVIEARLQPYDVQAVIPIIEGAGGLLTDWSGAAADQGGQVVAAGDRHLHEAVLGILAPARAEEPGSRA